MTVLRFNEALRNAVKAANDPELPREPDVRIVRDVYGRLRFAVNSDSQNYPAAARERLEASLSKLGNFATTDKVMFRDDFSNPDSVFNSPDWKLTTVDFGPSEGGDENIELAVQVLDRQVMGQDWLRPTEDPSPHPHRFVFYGLKGGVGRSTALVMAAYGFAREGKRVLLFDFDLESPGLSGLLLPPERVAEFGLVDWFIEDAVGQGDSVLRKMVSDSPLADTTTGGSIRVVAAMGNSESSYLSKLSRVYVDVPGSAGAKSVQRFSSRMRSIVQLLEAQEKPDVVLIDSRAGLHDVAAISITGLANTALLFATDSAQNWLGYRQLFTHWQRHPEVCANVRDRLSIVQALAPKGQREARSTAFLNHAYELFSSTLYDEIPPATDDPAGAAAAMDLYNPSMEDESAPHFPIRVDWDDVFQEFDPRVRPEQGGVSDAEIDAKFGSLISWLRNRVLETSNG